MNFLDLVKQRASIRKYEHRPIEEEKLNRIVKAGHVAPTAANNQPVHLFAITSKDGLAKLATAANIYDAPCAIITCVDPAKAWVRPFDGFTTSVIDASIVTDHMMLAACAEGLGSLWVCYFKKDVLKQVLGVPEHLEPINILAIGYGLETSNPNRHAQTRIPLSEFISYL